MIAFKIDTAHSMHNNCIIYIFYRFQELNLNGSRLPVILKFNGICIGALDGEHITIRPPANSGSYYYNYKNAFSIVLMALVNASYRFIYVDIGCNGHISDGGIFKNCSF